MSLLIKIGKVFIILLLSIIVLYKKILFRPSYNTIQDSLYSHCDLFTLDHQNNINILNNSTRPPTLHRSYRSDERSKQNNI